MAIKLTPITTTKKVLSSTKDFFGIKSEKSEGKLKKSLLAGVVYSLFIFLVILNAAFMAIILFATVLIFIVFIINNGAFITPIMSGSRGPGGEYPMCFPTNGLITSFAPHGRNNTLNGIDIANSAGTEIYATHDGIATCQMDPNDPVIVGSYGLYAIVTSDIVTTLYGHFDTCAIPEGSETPVSAGDLIGYMDNTGTSTGNHLHYEVRDGSTDSIYQYIPPYDGTWYESNSEGAITTDDVPETCYSRDVGGGNAPLPTP